MAFCSNCGKEIKDGEKFCTNCGKALGNDAVGFNQQPTANYNNESRVDSVNGNNGKKKKGKLGWIVAVVVIIILLLAVAGGTGRKTVQEKTTVGRASKSTGSDYKEVAGNYIGLHGSGLTLYPDGTADYYWKGYDHVDQGIKYTYENGRVTITTNVIDYPFYADKKDGESTLNFQADSSSWLDEDFIKVSDTAKGLSREEWNDEIEKKLNITIEDNDEKEATDNNATTKSTDDKQSAVKEEKKAEEKSSQKEEKKTDGVDPDLKAYLDSYESFMDDYIDFMKKYQSGTGDTLSMLTEYTEMLGKYQDFSEKINAYDTKKMSDADYKYYMEVTTRVMNKMAALY